MIKKTFRQDIREIVDRGEFKTKVQIIFGRKSAGEDFDQYQKNYTFTNLAPITIYALVREPNADSLVYRQLGQVGLGAIEIVCNDKYYDWFKKCTKIRVNAQEYVVYKDSTGIHALLQKRVGGLMRTLLQKV